jgi:hypothetical protein
MMRNVRPLPEGISISKELIFSVGIILLRLLLGFLAKAMDNYHIIGEIGTRLSMWVFSATLIAAFSRHPITAAINVMLFFLAMLTSYYTYGQIVEGFFPKAYFMGWLVVSFLSPMAGFIMWFSKGNGIIGLISAALPIALIFAENYPALYTHKTALAIGLGFGLTLCMMLPTTLKQKTIVFVLSIVLAFFIDRLTLISLLPW